MIFPGLLRFKVAEPGLNRGNLTAGSRLRLSPYLSDTNQLLLVLKVELKSTIRV